MEVLADIYLEDQSKILVTIPFVYKDLLLSIPGASFSSRKNVWTLPLTYPGVLALYYTFKDGLKFGNSLQEWLDNTLNTRIRPALAMRNVTEAAGYPELYPHQNGGVRFLTTAKRAILADDLGSGKTRTAFSSVRRLYEMGENPFPVLVVAPNSTKIGWKREIEAVWPGLKVVVTSGSATQRKKQFKDFIGSSPCPVHQPVPVDEDAKPKRKSKKKPVEPVCSCPGHVLVTNWEAVKGHSRLSAYGSISLVKCAECGGGDPKITEAKCHVHKKELNQINFQTIIGDEVHRIKDGSTQQARAFKAASGDAPYRFALTGTPVANAPDDLWSILNWLDPAAFPSKTKFIDRYLDVSENMYGAITILGIKRNMEAEFFGFLDPILRRMPKEVILPFLPPKVYQRRDVEMSPKQKKAYEQMRDKMVAELEGGDLLITTSPLTKMTRLLQFASSYAEMQDFEVTDKDTGEKKIIQKAVLTEPSNKIDAFMEDIESFGGKSVIVFSPSKQVINLLSKKLDRDGIKHGRVTGDEDDMERQIHMDNFQNGYTQFILCTTGAGGTGITLTRGSIAAYLGRPWSNIESEQSEGRNHRLGSEIHDEIVYIDYVSQDTVEEAVFDALGNKQMQLQTILRDNDLIMQAIKEGKIEAKG